MDQSVFAICMYGIWLWPLMIMFGLAFGIKQLINGAEYYFVPLIIGAFGLMMLTLPLYF